MSRVTINISNSDVNTSIINISISSYDGAYAWKYNALGLNILSTPIKIPISTQKQNIKIREI